MMNITLRKANVVQNSINDAIKAIDISVNVEINEFQDIDAVIASAQKKLADNDHRRDRLLVTLYNIRGLVGQANADSGIDLALARAAYIDKRLGQLAELASATVITDMSVIKGKIDKIKNSKDEGRRSLYGYSDAVTTSVLSQEKIDQIKNEVKVLKKQKQKLNDEILELNIKTDIPLSDEAVAILQAEGLI